MINLDQIIDQAVSNNVNAQAAIASVAAATDKANEAAAYANSAALNKQLVENKALEVANNRAAIEANTAIVAVNLAETDRLVDLAITAKILAEQYRDDALGFLSLTGLKYDHFDDRYLGPKDTDPLLDNDSWPIIDGALYWNNSIKGMRVFDVGLGVWKDISAASGALLLANNLSDLPDVSAARTNLSVYSKLETDAAIGAVVATKGQPNGITPLNASGMIDVSFLPSYVDDVIEVATKADLPAVGETDKIYVVVTDETSSNDTSTYRWTGTSYAIVSNTLNGDDVAALYEGVPDVNRFTDAEKTKLAGIETGATADQLASEVPYSNTISGLVATNVQAAIDELDANLETHALDTSTHGVGTVVGTTEVQVLTNKTLEGLTNTIGADHVHYKVRNNTGTAIAKGTVVKAVGAQLGSDYIQVEPTVSSADVALGIAETTIDGSVGWVGLVVNTGTVVDLDTSMWTQGTMLYSNGASLTSTKPASGQYQACAVVLRQHSTQGSLLVEFSEPTMIASTTQAGYVQLNDTLTSTSVVMALTANQGKVLKDAINDRYTKLEVDTKLAAQNEASEIGVTPQGNLSSTTVQSALVELQADIDTLLVDIEW